MRNYILILIFFVCLIKSALGQDKPLPSKAFQFSKPKSSKEGVNQSNMKSKSIKSSDILEEEETPSQGRVIRRVGVASNIPRVNNQSNMGGTQNPGYNPALKEAEEKRKASAPPAIKKVSPLEEPPKKTEPTRMKVAPSVTSPK